MKIVILAGGLGTRLAEETSIRPKPMIDIGEKPILWHIMKSYAHQGFNDFVVCLGYKGHQVKEWFSNYRLHNSDITINLKTDQITLHKNHVDDWKITLVDTGFSTQTGGRIKRVKDYIDGTFMLTYGDGIGNVDIKHLLEFHKKHGKLATVTAVQPQGRFGVLELGDENSVKNFGEKIDNVDKWVNGGFFVLEPGVMPYIDSDDTSWEEISLKRLQEDGQLMAYRHTGFWKAMDTLRDKRELESLWKTGNAPWKVW